MHHRPFILNRGELVEVRFLGPHRWALYTSDPTLIEASLVQSQVTGLDAYQTLNPVAPGTPEKHGVHADVLFQASRGQLSSDADIQRRAWLLLDSDVVKATGTAATEAQRKAAQDHSAELEGALTFEGWPRPLVFDSGNGTHRAYRIDLANACASDFLLSNLLYLAARRFDRVDVTLDKSVSNAARITRLYGCRNHKAGRDSAVLSVPDVVTPVSLEQIATLVEKWRGSLGYKKPLVTRAGSWTPERIEELLAFYSIDYRPPAEIPAGLLWVLTPCPLNADHAGTSPAVILTRTGWPKFRCLHHSCSGVRWAEFCKRLYRMTGKWFLYVA
jgi:hypothetical protein